MAKKGKHAKTRKSKNTESKQISVKSEVADTESEETKEENSEELLLPLDEDTAEEGAFTPAFDVTNSSDKNKSNATSSIQKKLGITFGVIVVLLLSIYLAGALAFTMIYAPNTKICGIDFSFKQPYDLASMLNNDFESYKMNVKGENISFEIDAKNANINADTETIANIALETFDIWTWPKSLFQQRDLSDVLLANLNEGNLSSIVNKKITEANENKSETKDACIAWDKNKSEFVIKEEIYGKQLDESKVKQTILSGIVHLSDTVTLDEKDRITPTIFKDDNRFNKAFKEANKIGSVDFHILINEMDIASIDGQTSEEWIMFDDPFTIHLDEDKVKTWTSGITENLNTVGDERKYTRPDGKNVTVTGGTYGWQVDVEQATNQIIEAIKAGSKENVVIEAAQTASVFAKKGEQDWSKRYVDIDISEQHARFYNENGDLVWESDVVTGKPENAYATPQGVYMVNRKQSPSRLRGPMVNGKAEWDSVVQYWMPFVDNLIGLHDAKWQATFGGQRYAQGYGSHGCVNLPVNAAGDLYNIINEGDVVVVHY